MGNIIAIEGARASVKASTAQPLVTFEGYLRTWRNAAPSTISRYRSGLRYLERAIGKPFTSNLDEKLTKHDVIDAVTHSAHLKPESLAAIIKSGKAWEKAGNFLGWWDQTEIQEISFSVPPTDPRPPLTPEQVRIAWSACRRRGSCLGGGRAHWTPRAKYDPATVLSRLGVHPFGLTYHEAEVSTRLEGVGYEMEPDPLTQLDGGPFEGVHTQVGVVEDDVSEAHELGVEGDVDPSARVQAQGPWPQKVEAITRLTYQGGDRHGRA